MRMPGNCLRRARTGWEKKSGDGVRQAWCPRADVEGQANVLRDDAPFQDVGRRVPDAVPVLKKLAHSDGGRGLLPLSSERFDEIAAGAVHRAASATLRPVVPDVDARRELGVAAGALRAGRTVEGECPQPDGQHALEGAVQVWVGEEGIDGGIGSIQSVILVPLFFFYMRCIAEHRTPESLNR